MVGIMAQVRLPPGMVVGELRVPSHTRANRAQAYDKISEQRVANEPAEGAHGAIAILDVPPMVLM